MAKSVTFDSQRVICAGDFDNQNSFLLINVTILAISEIQIQSLWRTAEMVKCKKSAPKALTDKGRVPKEQILDRKNGSKRYVYH